MDEEKFIVHLNPVWRDRADFIVMARLEGDVFEGHFEQLWARKLGDNRLEICCIPFFVRDLDLADQVEAAAEEDIQYLIQKVVARSGHYTFRAWFGETNHPDAPEEVMKKMEELQCLWEWHSTKLLALDAPSEEKAQQIADYLLAEQALGHLLYETGHTK